MRCANDSTLTQQKRAAWGNGGETASLQAIDPADGRRILDRYRQAGVHQMIEEEPNIVTSGKSQRVIIDGHPFSIEIYRAETDQNWMLEIVDQDGTSHVWDDHFASDKEARNAAMQAIEEEGAVAFMRGDNVIRFRGR